MQFSYLLLAFAGVAYSLPTFAQVRRALINIDPDIALALGINIEDVCLGLGIADCNPVNVGGEQNVKREPEAPKERGLLGDGPLINIAPVIDPDVNVNTPNDCLGLGIAACNPVNVNGDQNV